MSASRPNHPAAGKAGIALRLRIEHPCPGLPEAGTLAAMRALTAIILAVVTLVFVCSCRHAAPASASEFRYLGIPADEEYPHTRFQLDSGVPHKYWRVSRLSHVSESEYQQDLERGKILFAETHGGTQYYATEFTGDFEQQDGVRAWVTILQRKAHP
jgi:hypothetical protein